MRNFLKHSLLPATVFITGACVLIIEIVAVRVLSPYYGNTIFSYSSVISVILAALSAGYYFGGVWADKRPSLTRFFGLIVASSVTLLVLHFTGLVFLPLLSAQLPMTTGPLITSALLFLLPAFLLGTLSPYAIKLQSIQRPEQGIGAIAGTMFFWSTTGSISGSLFAGFYLIPNIGVQAIFVWTGLALLALGAAPLLYFGWRKKTVMAAALVALIFANGISGAAGLTGEKVLYKHDGLYEQVVVYDGWEDGRPARFMKQDRSRSAAMFLDADDPTDLVFDYTRYYSVYDVFGTQVDRALVIGAGAYSIPKALLADLPQATIDVVDIEPELEAVSRQYFNLPQSERLRSFTEDGRRFLAQASEPYDYIFSDVYHSLYSIPSHFTTREFFLLVKERLTPGGLFVANVIGDLSRQEPSIVFSQMRTMQSVFPNSFFFATESPASPERQNIMFVAYNSEARLDITHPAIIDTARFELSAYPVLTDDYAPVEAMTAKLIARADDDAYALSGEEMLALVKQQLRYGPRHVGADGRPAAQEFLAAELRAYTAETIEQTWSHTGADGRNHYLTNVIGRLFPAAPRRIILGTHSDSKKLADLDERHNHQPVPGANDGASGVAVLLALAKTWSQSHVTPAVGIDIVLFDGEEGDGSIASDYTHWQPLGSTYFAAHLADLYGEIMPEAAVIVDMVCDSDLQIKKEPTSYAAAPHLVDGFWKSARGLAPEIFVDAVGRGVRDDHTPLNAAGIPSMLVIDYEYPYFHTIADTADKCSAQSLQTVAEAINTYVYSLR